MRLSQLLNRRVELSVEVEGGEIKFTHNPAAYTLAFQEELRAMKGADDEETALRFYSTALPKLVTEWDLVDDKGKTVPVTADTIRQIPLDVLNAMMEAINVTRRPFETEKPSEGTGSFS